MTVEAQDQNAPRSSVRGTKPGIMPNLLRPCMEHAFDRRSEVPECPLLLQKLSEIDPVKFDDSFIEVHGKLARRYRVPQEVHVLVLRVKTSSTGDLAPWPPS